MTMTPDLQPDEFEIITVCPVGDCLAQHAIAFKIMLKDDRKLLADAKALFFKQVEKAHRDGRHKPEAQHGQ